MGETRILIVEDEGLTARHLQNCLRGLGYVVPGVVTTGEEAIERAAQTQPDLALMDIGLRGSIDGVQAAEQILTRFDIPVVYLTAYADDITLQRATVSEPFGYILKPFEERDLRVAIEMALHSHKLKKELRESEARYRAIVEDQTELVCRFLPDGTLAFVNEAYCRYFRKRREELIGRSFMPFIPDEDRAQVKQQIASLSRGKTVATHEHRVLTSDGEIRWQQWTRRAIFDAHGQLVEFQAVGRDITERKQAEEALRQSEERYRRITRATTDYIYTVRVEGGQPVETTHGPGCVAVTGYTADELTANPYLWLSMGDERDREAIMEQARHVLAGGAVEPLEHRITRQDGALRWVRNTPVPHLDSQGKLLSYDGLITDITERKQAEEALRESEERYRLLVELLPDPVGVHVEGKLVFVNSATTDLVGATTPTQLIGTSFADYVHPDDLETVRKRLRPLRDGRRAPPVELRIIKPDGTLLYVESSSMAITYQGKPAVQFVAHDITERKRAEEALRESEERYRRRSAELQALYETSLRLNSQLETSELLRLIVEQAVTLLGAHAGCLYIYEPQYDELVMSVATSYFSEYVGIRLKPGEGLAGKVFESGCSVIVDDYSAWAGRATVYEGESRFKATLAVPLWGKEGVLGVLDIGNDERKQAFDEHDQWLAELFAAQSAAALENARLHADVRRRAREMAALNKAAQAMSSTLDRETVLRLVIDEVRTLLDAEAASVLLCEDGELVFAAAAGPGAAKLVGMRMPATAGIAGSVLRDKQAALVGEARSDARFYRGIDALTGQTTHSVAAVPMTVKGEASGVIEAVNRASGVFTQRDLEILGTMAGSAAIAIENARLYETEREQFQRLQQSQAQLIQAEKMAALGRLVASITHEINNPLQAVQGCLALAGEELEGSLRPEKLKRYVGMAGQEIERVAEIVRRMRDFYRPSRKEMQPTDVRAVLQSVLELANKQLQHSHVSVECGPASADLPLIQANPDYLKQVFLNLVLNAIDAMADKGGTLRVCMSSDQMPQRDGQTVPAVRIEFSDTGEGIPPEILSHIFEPFVTTKKSGTGLGLSISYGIIEAHHGQMTVTSQAGIGATFAILLPVE